MPIIGITNYDYGSQSNSSLQIRLIGKWATIIIRVGSITSKPIIISTPILVIGFNRPDKILTLLNVLSELGVENLYVSIDGPRNDHDRENCNLALQYIHAFREKFNLRLMWRESNLGCCLGVVSAIDWFFSSAVNGIILEDDCVPSIDTLTYFQDKLLSNASAQNPKIGMFSAHNPFMHWPNSTESNYFLIGAWATHATVWHKVRTDFFQFTTPQLLKNKKRGRKFSESLFWWANSNNARLGVVDTWDGIFSDRMWRLQFRSLVPQQNLIKNTGFGPEATHTKNPEETGFVDLKTYSRSDFDENLKKFYYKLNFFSGLKAGTITAIRMVTRRGRRDYEKILAEDIKSRMELKAI